MKLILGTVQLGLKYGKFMDKKISDTESLNILNYALDNNITIFDTAQKYGNSEKILSNISSNKSVRIITKIDFCDNKNVTKSINQSLKNLKIEKIDTLLLHNFNDVKNKNILDELKLKKNEGIIRKIGISVYNVEEAITALKNPLFQVIQIPFNFLDRQWDNDTFLNIVKERKIEVHIRSIFLQGILLNDISFWPDVENKEIIYQSIVDICEKYKITKMELIIRYSLSFDWIYGIVFGVNSISQIKENIDRFKNLKGMTSDMLVDIINTFQNCSEKLLNPSLWR